MILYLLLPACTTEACGETVGDEGIKLIAQPKSKPKQSVGLGKPNKVKFFSTLYLTLISTHFKLAVYSVRAGNCLNSQYKHS